jgi:ABC-type Mn2+/Zn2+ transport system permease subunit
VLLVFAFLIVPSLASILSIGGTWKRVAFGWGFGIAGCLIGLEASLRLDWSAGPTIVAAFILLLMVSGAVAKIRGGAGGGVGLEPESHRTRGRSDSLRDEKPSRN